MPEQNLAIEPLSRVFSSEAQVRTIAKNFGTPIYVYSQRLLEEQADKALAFPNAYGLLVRYAMKANPNANILRIFRDKGIAIDASSGYEVHRAIRAGIKPKNILLTSQIIPHNLKGLIDEGMGYNACSLLQLHNYGERFKGREVTVRINQGRGSGGTNRTNTAGESSSFGIWYEELPEVFNLAKHHGLKINRIHTHIGSGSDPAVWEDVAIMSLEIVKRFLAQGFDIRTLNLGGGYKIGRMSYEPFADMQKIGGHVRDAFERFYTETGQELKLEIEPGTFLVANAGAVIASVKDIKPTPAYDFIITDTGMNEVPRPTMYASQHPIHVVPMTDEKRLAKEYIVSGRDCESGDILTPSKNSPEELMPRPLTEAEVGDLIVIGGAGAYCSGMAFKNYNSYPEAAEVLLDRNNFPRIIRRRQTLDQIIQNEVTIQS